MAKNSVRIRLKAYEKEVWMLQAKRSLKQQPATVQRRSPDLFRCRLKEKSLQSCVLFISTRIPANSSRSAHTRD